jgi:hypothetical protein
MYKTIVTILSERPVDSDIDIKTLACAVDNGDDIGLVSIVCTKLDKEERAPYIDYDTGADSTVVSYGSRWIT